jgi:hypothetical protein
MAMVGGGAQPCPAPPVGQGPLAHRLLLGQWPPVPGGPELASAGPPLSQLAGHAGPPGVLGTRVG